MSTNYEYRCFSILNNNEKVEYDEKLFEKVVWIIVVLDDYFCCMQLWSPFYKLKFATHIEGFIC